MITCLHGNVLVSNNDCPYFIKISENFRTFGPITYLLFYLYINYAIFNHEISWSSNRL